MKSVFIKGITLILLVAVLATNLISCESRAIKSNEDALAAVGTVGEYEVSYEELYFLTHTYSAFLDATYGADASVSDKKITVEEDGENKEVVLSEYYAEELRELIYENIVSNYAVLTLAKESGLSLDSEDMKEKIQISLDAYIESDFGGKRSEYKKWLKSEGITDNYVRFTLGVDHLYSALVTEYLKTGIISDDNDYVNGYIRENFVRTWHIMISNEDGSSANYDRAAEALEILKSGEKSMYKMIGSKYNDDLTPGTLDGHYFTRGTMDEAYEKAAYALEVGEVSDIVASVGKDNGRTIDCYYIIQRLELEDAYIEKNFESLKSDYYISVVYDMVDELKSSLNFKFNEYGSSLNILSLKSPSTTDPVTVLVVGSIVVGTVTVALVTVTLVVMKKRKEKQLRLLAESKKR